MKTLRILYPYAQLAIIGWIVAANANAWQTAVAIVLLLNAAVGITALRLALQALRLAWIAEREEDWIA